MVSFRVSGLLLVALLVACGGGGGGGGGGDSGSGGGTTPPPVVSSGSFQLSGQINVADNTLVDSDLNESDSSYTSNDTLSRAQSLPNPVSLSGYVNVAGAGPAGRSKVAGDRSDVFLIDANQGQTVSLFVADPQQGDVDLYLYTDAGVEVANSVGTGKDESVIIPRSGRYAVQVYADTGASNYVLTVGQQMSAASVEPQESSLHSASEFVPGEVIVRWRNRAFSQSSNSREMGNAQNNDRRTVMAVMMAHGLTKAAGVDGGDWLLKLNQVDDQAQQVRQRVQSLQSGLAIPLSEGSLDKAATLSVIKRLRADPNVEYAEPNYIYRASMVPNDRAYNLQWHYPLINLPTAWNATSGSNTVTVAVIDTGVLLGHPDLQGQLIPGYDFISDSANAGDGGGIDNNPDDPGDKGNPDGTSSFHGTHVAGTIAAASNNAVGVAGVAGNVRVMPLRVLGRKGGTSFDIMQAVLFAARLTNSSGTLPAKRADIINLSLGGVSFSQAQQNTFTQVRAQGVIIVAAAGNERTSTRHYPSSYDGVISVSAVGINKTLASYSNFGSTVDVTAPGGDSGDRNGDGYKDGVLSTSGNDSSGSIVFSYEFSSGTSMASPHVAGVLALMKSVNPGLTPDQVDTLLAAGRLTTDIGAPGRDDNFGYGLIDALKAVQAAGAGGGGGATPALLVANTTSINLSPATSSQTILVGNGGDQPLQVTAVQVAAPANAWLSVAGPAAASGLGSYTINVNRTGLAPGAYSGTVRFISSANAVTVNVVMQVGRSNVGFSGNLGRQYILLLDAETLVSKFQVIAPASTAGAYKFQFNGIPLGTYKLFAGNDADNNGKICELGETCGSYINLSKPADVVVNGNRSDLVFDAEHLASFGAGAATDSAAVRAPVIQRLR